MTRMTQLLVGVALCASPAFAQQADLMIGSTSASSSHYGYFVAVGQIINDAVEGMDATVVETGATMDNLRRIERGQLDMGLVTTNVALQAVDGTGSFDGNPQDVSLMWVYTASPQNVVVRRDAGIETLEDAAKARMNPGIRGGGTEATSEAVFETLGLEAHWVRGSTTDVVDGIKDNRLAGYIKSGSGMRLDASSMDVATTTPIDVIGLSPDQADTLRETMPELTIVDVPAGAADGVEAYTTWSFGSAVGASSALSEEDAYKIVSAVMADETVQANAMAELRDASLADLTLQYGTVPLHPGAARWFEENGYDLPESLRPAE